jgi:hypothetical protein
MRRLLCVKHVLVVGANDAAVRELATGDTPKDYRDFPGYMFIDN